MSNQYSEAQFSDALKSMLREGDQSEVISGVDPMNWKTHGVHIESIREGPIVHEKLTDQQTQLCRQVFDLLAKYCFDTFAEFEEGFRRDILPDRELDIWLRMAKVFEVYRQRHPVLSRSEIALVTALLLSITTGGSTTDIEDVNKAQPLQGYDVMAMERELRALFVMEMPHGRFGQGRKQFEPQENHLTANGITLEPTSDIGWLRDHYKDRLP